MDWDGVTATETPSSHLERAARIGGLGPVSATIEIWKDRLRLKVRRWLGLERLTLQTRDLAAHQALVDGKYKETSERLTKISNHLRELHADMAAWLEELTPVEKARLAEAVKKRKARAERAAKLAEYAAQPERVISSQPDQPWPAREALPAAEPEEAS